MNDVWREIKDKISKVFQLTENDAYLYKLLDNLKEVQGKKIAMPFVIQSTKTSGYVVKIGGMYAKIAYRDMPWQYKSVQEWQAVSEHMIGLRFFGKVTHISTEKPFQIKISAKDHIFKPKELTVYEEYQVVIIRKAKYGLFVDAGFHFNWKYGSFLGLIHKSAFWDIGEYEQALEGGIISTFFHGQTKEGKLIFGSLDLQKEWSTGELEPVVGTLQRITVKISESGEKEFFVKDRYKAVLPATRAYYPGSYIGAIKDFKASLNDGDAFEAMILKISKRKHFVAKLVLT